MEMGLCGYNNSDVVITVGEQMFDLRLSEKTYQLKLQETNNLTISPYDKGPDMAVDESGNLREIDFVQATSRIRDFLVRVASEFKMGDFGGGLGVLNYYNKPLAIKGEDECITFKTSKSARRGRHKSYGRKGAGCFITVEKECSGDVNPLPANVRELSFSEEGRVLPLYRGIALAAKWEGLIGYVLGRTEKDRKKTSWHNHEFDVSLDGVSWRRV